MLGAYSKALQTMPLVTKGGTAALLFGIGDTLAQQTSGRGADGAAASAGHDSQRALAFVTFGGLFYAPTQHFWFAWMERNVAAGAGWAREPMKQATARVCLHSSVYAPFSIASLFIWMDLFSSSPAAPPPAQETLAGRAQRALSNARPEVIFPIWLAGGTFWIPTMLGIYRFVPLHGRVVVTSAANVAWSTYLSFKRAAAAPSTTGPVAPEVGAQEDDGDHIQR